MSAETAPAFQKGQAVIVAPAMTPMARHHGRILGKARHGWRVRFNAWGMTITETLTAREIIPAD